MSADRSGDTSTGRWVARRTGRLAVGVGSGLATALTLHAVVNLRFLRRPPTGDRCPPPTEFLSLLLPVRDEAARVAPCLRALLATMDDYAAGRTGPGAPGDLVELVVFDDGSTDGTAGVVTRVAGADPRVRLLTGTASAGTASAGTASAGTAPAGTAPAGTAPAGTAPAGTAPADSGALPAGWLGKPHACAELAAAADPRASILAFIDADVVVAPDAARRCVALLRSSGLDLVCPYPRQLFTGVAQRLVQPLLQWSWATTLPLRLAERSPRPSLAAANGQLLLVDRGVYARAGGHAGPGVRGAVLEDIALLRSVKAAGGHGGVVDGTDIAACAMYGDAHAMVAGYTKSLWAAFGPRPAAAAVLALLALAYVVPAAAMVAGNPVGAVGYGAAVAGRVAVARRTGGRELPDCLAHPLSVLAFSALVGRSWRARRRGTLNWRGRPVTVAAPGARA